LWGGASSRRGDGRRAKESPLGIRKVVIAGAPISDFRPVTAGKSRATGQEAGIAADLLKAIANGLGERDQHLRFLRWQVDATVPPPQIEPDREVLILKPQGNVLHRHRPPVGWLASGRRLPEVGQILQMRRPIMNMSGEDRAKNP